MDEREKELQIAINEATLAINERKNVTVYVPMEKRDRFVESIPNYNEVGYIMFVTTLFGGGCYNKMEFRL